ncbi:MAG: ferrous iron transport protein A [Kiritimatiellae bacterium]|nr:ferrous iron transport protein A [Kiritimatiellia bacterium]
MPLAMLKVGEQARVTAITGTDTVRKHLGSLGFVPGVVISVVQVANGSMILGLQDSRIAVNDDLARRIIVKAA